MSISGLYLGTRALSAQQIALEVTGQNIANVNTEGYTRQRANLVTSDPVMKSFGALGTGVEVNGIQQIKDVFIDTQLRGQKSTLGEATVRTSTYDQLEKLFNDPSDVGLDTLLGDFFDSLDDLVNSPEDIGIRDTVVLKAQTLTQQIGFVNSQLDQLRLDMNDAVISTVDSINTLTQQIADYNEQIVKVEAGTTNMANDLRDQRERAIQELAGLTNIRVFEMDSGAVNVSINGLSVVFNGTANELSTRVKAGDELPVYDVVVESTGAEVVPTSGELAGYLTARDTDIVSYITKLDELAAGLVSELNQIHVGGRGLSGFSTVTSATGTGDTVHGLDNCGLTNTPVDTTFTINVYDSDTGTETAVAMSVDVSTDALEDMADNITTALAAAGFGSITATVDSSNNTMTIASGDATLTFTFSDVTDDPNNVLSVLGLNTFFTGTDASNIDVNSTIADHPEFIAAATTDQAGDNTNALAMTELRDAQVMSSNTRTIEQFYQSMIVQLGSESSDMQIEQETADSFLTKLNLTREQVSGVSLDEEAANLIRYQRAYEASARFISVIDEILNVLVNGLV